MSRIILASVGAVLLTGLILGCALASERPVASASAPAPKDQNGSMPNQRHRKYVDGTVGVFALMPDAPRGWTPVHSREDCLVQVRVEEKGRPVTATEWSQINYRSGPIWLFEAPRAGLAAYIYRQHSHSLYFLYAKNCESKYHVTKELLAQMKDSVKGFPNYEVLHQKVQPSTKTLNICGHWWKDGEKGKCHISLARRAGSTSGV